MTLMQTLAADISAELAATEPRRQIDSPYIARRAATVPYEEAPAPEWPKWPVKYVINQQGIILNAEATTFSTEDAVALSDFIIRHNAAAREKSVLSR